MRRVSNSRGNQPEPRLCIPSHIFESRIRQEEVDVYNVNPVLIARTDIRGCRVCRKPVDIADLDSAVLTRRLYRLTSELAKRHRRPSFDRRESNARNGDGTSVFPRHR